VNSHWISLKDGFTRAAEPVLVNQERGRKEWITNETWTRVQERGKIRAQLLQSKSERLRARKEVEYTAKNKEVKKSARRDKRAFFDLLAGEAETAAARGDIAALHKITARLCGTRRTSPAVVKGLNGESLTTEGEQAKRWFEHFQGVLNQPYPDNPLMPAPAQEDLEIDIGAPTRKEIGDAILSLRNGKAAGIDAIHAEMLKADLYSSVSVLCPLFHKVWDREEIPEDWSKGLIVKVPKKGDLTVCDSWRGITLLPIPSKVFCRVILNRMAVSLDKKLREEQAGFRRGRGCIDQIFALRNIVEQCLEWNAPLFINFVDFKKAFDSVHRESLWAVMRHYGVPQKVVSLIALFYERFECGVIVGHSISDFFGIKTGVRQGCILSPLLFLVLIDYVMRITNDGLSGGVRWRTFPKTEYLEDLDFADDLALLACTESRIREKTSKLWRTGKRVGLEINADKTELMCINTSPNAPLNVGSKELSCVDNFTYLGSVISREESALKDTKSRLGKARGAFVKLRPVWRSSSYSIQTKTRLYNSIVKTVLLYGSERWRVVDLDFQKLDAFHNGCLRKICRIFWPRVITNEDLYVKTNSEPMRRTVQKRRLKWLGHVLRMPPERIPKVALHWTPQGKRSRGRPKMTWRRAVEKELKTMKLTWGEAEAAAKDRIDWRQRVEASCSARS